MAANIDLGAFTKGAQQANQDNWRDVQNDINTRAAEEMLRQSQLKFNTDLPGYQLGREVALDQGMGAQRGVEFQVGVLSEMGKLPPEQQAGFLADSFRKRLANISPTAGGAQELNALRDMVTMQANKFLAAGDTRSAEALYAAIPGAGQAQADQRGEVAKWSNPQTAFDEMNLMTGAAQIGARYNPQNKMVQFPDGTLYDAPRFAQYMRDRALNPFADRTPGLLAEQQRQLKLAEGDKLVELYRQNGYVATKDPITGAVTPLFQVNTAPAASGVGMSYAPGVSPQLSPSLQAALQGGPVAPLPGATGQTFATPAVSAVPAVAPVAPVAPAVAPQPLDPIEQLGQEVDSARTYRAQLQATLRSFGLAQRAQNPQAYQIYLQEFEAAKQREAAALQKYQTGLGPLGAAFTTSNWLTQPGTPR